MKIFISHSSRQKLFARELMRRLPPSIEVWIDEQDLPVGSYIKTQISDALSSDLLAVVLIVDYHSANSEWVRREIEATIAVEKRSSENLLIPIVLESAAVEALDYCDLRDRKYLTCYDFSEESLDSVARQLISTCLEKASAKLAALSRELATISSRRTIDDLPDLIRSLVFPYRGGNPITIERFRSLLDQKGHSYRANEDVIDKLEELRSSGKLLGIYFDEEEIFLSMENVADKRHLNADEKKRIARFASKLVSKGQSVAVDSGSTTLTFVEHLSRRISSRSLQGVTLYTNSVPAANKLLETLSDMKLDDDTKLCRICLLGGWCRPTSQGTIPLDDDYLSHLPSEIDVAMMGCNGIVGEEGLGNSTDTMLRFKIEVIQRAKRIIFLMESQKFEIPQAMLIQPFCKEMEIVTGNLSTIDEAVVSKIRALGVTIHES